MTTQQQRENAQQIRMALLLAMQDVGNPKDIIESEYFCGNDSVPATEVHLTEAMGGSGWNMTSETYPKQEVKE